MKHRALLAAAILATAAAVGCANDNKNASADSSQPARKLAADARKAAATAVCEIHAIKNSGVTGTVTFTEEGGKVKVMAHITGLKPNSKHAIHIHEGTECGDDGMKAGGHYNPDKHEHGLPDKEKRHAGDFGNLSTDDKGMAHLELTVDNISINGAKNPIMGRAMIVHEKADDGGQPTGNAGGRIGCGIIKVKDAAAGGAK
jgi:superoxide dismutase, Cu-Zn family